MANITGPIPNVSPGPVQTGTVSFTPDAGTVRSFPITSTGSMPAGADVPAGTYRVDANWTVPGGITPRAARLGHVTVGSAASYALSALLTAGGGSGQPGPDNPLLNEIRDAVIEVDQAKDATETDRAAAEAARVAAQLAASQAQASALTVPSWASLAVLTATVAGTGAEVLDADTGTHTDPVAGGTVPNAGRYSWSASPAGWRRIGDTGLTAKASKVELAQSSAFAAYRANLGWYEGDLPSGSPSPILIGSDDRVLISSDQAEDYAVAMELYRQNLGWYEGDLPSGADAPLLVGGDNRVLVGAGEASGGEGPAWLTRAIQIWSNSGQSNAVGAVDGPAELIYPHQSQELLALARGGIVDQWTGLESGGGNSYQLDAASVTGIAAMQVLFSTRGQGTTAAEAAARAAIAQGRGPVLLWNNAEGGQSIANLMPDAPSGYHSFANYVKMLSRAQALKPAGARLVHAWTFCQQGESNTTTENLGALHNALRAAYEGQARAILGQTEALRMIDWQASSFGSSSVAVRSILAEALSQRDAAAFICGGPTYGFPFKVEGHEGDAAYLHNSSLGHAMCGELGVGIARRVEADGFYLPLHAVSAAVTGANTITVRMSEAIEVATDEVVAVIANHGITLSGGSINAVAVSGEILTITTAAAAAGVTAVNIGLTGQTTPRTEARIPRTNLRAVRPLGTYSWGGLIRAWACHQSLEITA